MWRIFQPWVRKTYSKTSSCQCLLFPAATKPSRRALRLLQTAQQQHSYNFQASSRSQVQQATRSETQASLSQGQHDRQLYVEDHVQGY